MLLIRKSTKEFAIQRGRLGYRGAEMRTNRSIFLKIHENLMMLSVLAKIFAYNN